MILDLKQCPADILDDLPYIQASLIEAATSIGATVVGETFHKFSPQGVTGVVAIAESHICIHTWPEFQYAAADIFTCGEGFDPHAAAEHIIAKLKAGDATVTELARGNLETLATARG